MAAEPSERAGARRDLTGAALLVLVACLLLLPGLGRMAAMDTTDARYLEVAREMLVSGDWLVPQLAGVPHLDKPPLTYWAAALGFRALGVTPFAGRLLEQLALLATALLVFAFCRVRIGATAAWSAAGILLTSGLVFGSSRGLNTDLFQLLFLTAGLLALYEASRGGTGAAVLGLALLGVSMLVKGPIALLVALSVAIPFLVLRRGERWLSARGCLIGAALFVAIGFPWYALLVQNDPALLRWFVEHQILARVSGGSEGHRHGPLYLPVHALVGALPWTPLALLALWRMRPQRQKPTPALDLFLLLWALVPCLLFELFATKLPTYLLPAFPAIALAIARAQARGLLEDAGGRAVIALSVTLAGLGALGLAGVLGAVAAGISPPSWLEPGELEAPAVFALALALAGGLALSIAMTGIRRLPDWSLPRGALAAGLVFALGAAAIAPALPQHEDEARIVRSVPGARVVEYGVFEIGLLFYARDIERFYVAVQAREASRARRDPRATRLGLRRQDVAALVSEPEPTFVLGKRSHAEALCAEFGLRVVRQSRRYVLLANRAALAALAPEDRETAESARQPEEG